MITKEEFFRRLNEKYPDKKALDSLAKAGERVMHGAEKLKEKTIVLSLPSDMTLDSVVDYVEKMEKELADGAFSILGAYGFYQDVRNYIGWKRQISEQLLRREFFYDLIAGRQYDPAGRKLAVCDTVNTNSTVLKEVLTICDGAVVDSLEKADTAVYLGMRFCDPKDNREYSEYPLYEKIIPWLQKDKDKAAFVFYNPRETGVCSDEGDLHTLRHLANERENIFFIPLDWYKGRIFTT